MLSKHNANDNAIFFSTEEGVLQLLLNGVTRKEEIETYLYAYDPDLEVRSVTIVGEGRARVEVVGLKG